MLNIAIDGPSGAGKSSVAKEIAKRKKILYLDTGALYRAIGLYALEQNKDTKDKEQVELLLKDVDIELKFKDGAQHILLNGRDVSDLIRTQQVAMAASNVSALPPVREFLLSLQRDIAAKNDCIMDGRDIGTVILPNADIKIFLTASPEKRAYRRYIELKQKGQQAEYEDVLKETLVRDENDASRALAPLKPAHDAIIVDNTDMDLNQLVDFVSNIIGDLV